jgi:hypothetical protein
MPDSCKKIHYKSSRNTVLDNVFTVYENAKMKQEGTQIAEIDVEDFVSECLHFLCELYTLEESLFYDNSKKSFFTKTAKK